MTSTPARKSDRTRAAILAAAAELFAKSGFERTTVREVAERAGIDPALVIRYFKSKDRLFAEAATIRLGTLAPAGTDASTVGAQLIAHFLDLWEGAQSGQGMTVLLRSAASNEQAAAKMRKVFLTQVVPVVSAFGDPATSAARAGLVSSQLLGLAMCRYVLKLPPVVALSRDQIIATVGPVLQRYVTASNF